VVVPVDPANLAPGDVVSMRVAEANAIFTHRIEAVVDRPDGRYVRTKGDANPDADPTLVKASAIIGRVELSIPYMGYLLALLSIPTGVIFVVGLAATLLSIAWLLESLEPIPSHDRRRGAVPAVAFAAAGDVVSMHVAEANAIFTHRIEAVVDRADGRYVRTKGDANPDADPTLVSASAIIGRVELSIPYMGYLLALLSIPTGVIFVVGLAATLLAIAWLLESLEPIPGADRPRGAVPAAAAATAGGPSAGPSSDPALPPVLRPAPGPLVLALVAPGTRTPLLRDPAGRARPSAREQIARSRSQRDRRLRWRTRHPESTAE